MRSVLPESPLAELRCVALGVDDIPRLQRFYEANPQYFVAVNGEPPGPREAHDEIHGELPAGWSYSQQWMLGFADAAGELAAMANVVTDLLAIGVWHIGLFIVATARHGNGDAQQLYDALERWSRDNGAQWLRLGVVSGNERAERFWKRQGFVAVRLRDGVETGRLRNSLRVMVKPLAGRPLDEYLAMVERDRPGA